DLCAVPTLDGHLIQTQRAAVGPRETYRVFQKNPMCLEVNSMSVKFEFGRFWLGGQLAAFELQTLLFTRSRQRAVLENDDLVIVELLDGADGLAGTQQLEELRDTIFERSHAVQLRLAEPPR